MAKKVPATKSEIMAALAEAAGISKKQAVAAYEKLLAIAYEGAKGPKGIMLPGLGKVLKAKSKARMGRNPATGAAIKRESKISRIPPNPGIDCPESF